MARIVYCHWHPDEARERSELLRGAGHEVRVHADQGGDGLKAIAADLPEAVVIDLRRLPAHGRTIGVMLRQRRSTRGVPLVFVEGDPTKTDAVRTLLPDAVFTPWRRVRGAVRDAIARPPAEPVAPGLMESHAGTPLVRKLGIRAGDAVALLGAPPEAEAWLVGLPADVALRRRAGGSARVVMLCVRRAAELSRRFEAATRTVAEGGRLWIVWPKKTSPLSGDLGANEVRAFGLARDWVDFKICRVDADWSGLCFTRRKP